MIATYLLQGSLTNFLEAVESRAGGSQGQAVQDFLQSCTQGLEELSLLSGVGSSCLVVEDACDAIHVCFIMHNLLTYLFPTSSTKDIMPQ